MKQVEDTSAVIIHCDIALEIIACLIQMKTNDMHLYANRGVIHVNICVLHWNTRYDDSTHCFKMTAGDNIQVYYEFECLFFIFRFV